MANGVTISNRKLHSTGGVVVLPVAEYRRLVERDNIPEYYLTGKAATDLDKLVAEGLKEHKEGKTIKASSVTEALKIYARGKKFRG